MPNEADNRVRRLMLQAVPDVGPVRAAALVDAFGTIEAIAACSIRDLATTTGIGPVIAERLKRIASGGES